MIVEATGGLLNIRRRMHDRLVDLVEVDRATGCWVFIGDWDEDGRGLIRINGQTYPAHRVMAWACAEGDPDAFDLDDPSILVLNCATPTLTPACIHPAHLLVMRPLAFSP